MNGLVLKNIEVMSHDEGHTATLGFCPSLGSEDRNMKVYASHGSTESEAVSDLVKKMIEALNGLLKR